MKDFLSVIEFAETAGVHPNTVRKAIKKGRISAFKIGSGKNAKYLIARSEFNRISLIDLEIIVKNMAEDMIKKGV